MYKIKNLWFFFFVLPIFIAYLWSCSLYSTLREIARLLSSWARDGRWDNYMRLVPVLKCLSSVVRSWHILKSLLSSGPHSLANGPGFQMLLDVLMQPLIVSGDQQAKFKQNSRRQKMPFYLNTISWCRWTNSYAWVRVRPELYIFTVILYFYYVCWN